MNPLTLIIEHPAALNLSLRLGWQLLATVLWGMWLSCWTPLATLAVWELGLYQLNAGLMLADSLRTLQQIVTPCLSVIVLQSAALLGWASHEYWRFGGQQRRQATAAVALTELAHYGQLSPAALAHWQTARCIVAWHDEAGGFQHARIQERRPARIAR